ncbi:unnamed protein product, partial [Ectocarpus sp. 12 AP-2014]
MLHKAELDKKDGSSPTPVLKYERKALTDIALLGALVKFVVLDQQPFNVVQASSLENLIQVATNDTNLKLPSRPTDAKKVWTMAVCAESVLHEKMTGTNPALTTRTAGPPTTGLRSWLLR